MLLFLALQCTHTLCAHDTASTIGLTAVAGARMRQKLALIINWSLVKYQTLRTLLALARIMIWKLSLMLSLHSLQFCTPYVCKAATCFVWIETSTLVSYGFSQNLADPGCYTITVDGHL